MSATALTPDAIHLTEQQEGCVLHRYADVDGTLTIGYGTTAGAGVVDPLPETCTQAQAQAWLLEYMNRSVVPAALATGFDFNENQLGGCADLGYNAGAGVFERDRSMGIALRSKNLAQIRAAFMVYTKDADGNVLPDLVHRREADIAMFDAPVPYVPSFHYDWFLAEGHTDERATVEKYDKYRALQTRTRHPDRFELTELRAKCKAYAARLWTLAHEQKIDGKPSWGEYHRGWRHVELSARAAGKLVQPS